MNLPEFRQAIQRSRPAYRLYRWAWAELDLLYPPVCGGCSQPGARWCAACQAATHTIPPPVCEKCGRSLPNLGVCSACRANPPAYTALRSWAAFEGPLRLALHRLKYGGDMALGEALARPLIDAYRQYEWEIDLATPIPLGASRRQQRGYNQAALLAWPLALSSGLPYTPKALAKVRDTPTQVGLNLDERQANVAGAFQASRALVVGKTVLIVDDVTTSGATIQAASLALLEEGARRVYGLTLSRAVHPPNPT